MNLTTLSKNYNTQEKCLTHLENVRWAGAPWCPHCNSGKITPRKKRPHFFHCNKCNKDFTVLYGTIFEGSKLPLPKWFQLISLMLNAKKGISSKQIQRTLGVTYKSAWYSAMRVRCAMVDEHDMLEGIIEMDEAYIGGKPRHRNTDNSTAFYSKLTTKRGAGTKNIPIVGAVQRNGKVRLEVKNRLSSKAMLELLKKYVATNDNTTIMTDESLLYKQFDKIIKHLTVNHSKKEYAKKKEGYNVHTNTIEGVWQAIKGSIKGQYHVLSRKYLPFYLAEFAYKYNRRNSSGSELVFDETIDKSVQDDKCLTDYKPKGKPDEIVYGKKAREQVVEEERDGRIADARNKRNRSRKNAKLISILSAKQKRLLKTNTMSSKKLSQLKKVANSPKAKKKVSVKSKDDKKGK